MSTTKRARTARTRAFTIAGLPVHGAATALLLLAGAGLAMAHGESHPTGHVKKPEGMTWPPQPMGIRQVQDFSDPSLASRRALAREAAFRAIEQRMAADTALRHWPLARMTRLHVQELRGSQGELLHTLHHYFDRQRNATVTVAAARSGALEVHVRPASQFQPEITEEEVAEAVALAKRHLAGRAGGAPIQRLQGYGIQAYRPEGNGLFDARVVYVSLHAHLDAPPEYMAYVDLTRQQVFGVRQELPR